MLGIKALRVYEVKGLRQPEDYAMNIVNLETSIFIA